MSKEEQKDAKASEVASNGAAAVGHGAAIRNFAQKARDDVAREKYIVDLPEHVHNRAALIMAHMLLPAGAKIVDMACNKGEMPYAMALASPRAEIIGVDRDPAAIEFARRTFRLPNLSYRVGDISITDFPDAAFDGIVNSNVFHRIYSAHGYDPAEVSALLERQIRKLKPGGIMLVRDFIKPPEEEFVLLELPDAPSQGTTVTALSLADLLVRFSQTARPLATGCEGFFIEELTPNREKTRLFRLPHKWALEFIYRKEYREQWTHELKKEYTFFTGQDYRREFARFGMRMVYSAPYWNPWVVKNAYDKKFQLYSEQGAPMSPPPTNNFIVAQKVQDKQSLMLEERRPSQAPATELEVVLVRDKKSGSVQELARRPDERCDIVPYRRTRDGRLVIYVRSGYPRPIVNAVYRGNSNLDGKRWSGHLVEPITMNTSGLTGDVEMNKDKIVEFADLYAGLKVTRKETLVTGAPWYPAPDRIDEAIEPVFMEVYDPEKTSWPIKGAGNIGFVEPGTIIELDAADIVRASQVGLLPEPRLELHVFDLMQRFGIKSPGWIGEKIPVDGDGKVREDADPEKMLADLGKVKFVEEKGRAKKLKAVRSTFVEEGKVGSAIRGLASKDVEFIVTDDGIENIAVVVPMTRGWDSSILIGVEAKMLPVPQRTGGDGSILVAPNFVLPKDVRTLIDARKFIAGKFGVAPTRVGLLGESYFTHIGMTPQRVYPFMVATEGQLRVSNWKFTKMKRIAALWYMQRMSGDLLKTVMRMSTRLDMSNGLLPELGKEAQRRKNFSLSTDKTELMDIPRAGGVEGAMTSRVLTGSRRINLKEPGEELVADPVVTKAEPVASIDVEQAQGADAKKSKGRLKSSYSNALGGVDVKVAETGTIKRIDRAIFSIGNKLKDATENSRRKLTLMPMPPKPPTDGNF